MLKALQLPRPCGHCGRRSAQAGRCRPEIFAQARNYADPLSGVEENIAYNAFLVGKSLPGMRVADVLKAFRNGSRRQGKPRRVIVYGRRDAALVACLAAAVDPMIDQVACEEMVLSFRSLFSAEGFPINAASILPGLLQKFGDVADVLAQVAPRKVLVASGAGGAAEHTHRRVSELSRGDSAPSRASSSIGSEAERPRRKPVTWRASRPGSTRCRSRSEYKYPRRL